MTKEESIKIFRELWTELGKTGEKDKQEVLYRLGYPKMRGGCPLCEFTESIPGGAYLKCFQCPIEWPNINTKVTSCMSSYYGAWVDAPSVTERKELAKIIAVLPEKEASEPIMHIEDVIKAIREHPERLFISYRHDRGKCNSILFAQCEHNAYLTIKDNKGNECNQRGMSLSRIWEPTTTPVTWQEAMESWLLGNSVICKLNVLEQRFDGDDQVCKLSKSQLNDGVWYKEIKRKKGGN